MRLKFIIPLLMLLAYAMALMFFSGCSSVVNYNSLEEGAKVVNMTTTVTEESDGVTESLASIWQESHPVDQLFKIKDNLQDDTEIDPDKGKSDGITDQDLTDDAADKEDDKTPPPANAAEVGDGSKAKPFKNTKYHHTQWNHPKDGGKSLVLCPGEKKLFSRCWVGTVSIPYHDNGAPRHSWWNMKQAPAGDINCLDKDGKYHVFKSSNTIDHSQWSLSGQKCK